MNLNLDEFHENAFYTHISLLPVLHTYRPNVWLRLEGDLNKDKFTEMKQTYFVTVVVE